MATQDQFSRLPLAGLVAVVAAAAAALLWQGTALEVPRPEGEPIKQRHLHVLQDIDARLWEDPLAVIARHERELKASKSDNSRKTAGVEAQRPGLEALCATFLDEPASRATLPAKGRRADPTVAKRVLVLGVMVSNAPYFDIGEQRARVRYAVHSALSAAHFVPDNSQHIGRVRYVMGRDAKGHENAFEIAFEALRRRPPMKSATAEDDPGSWASAPFHVLLLWLEEERFATVEGGTPRPIAEITTLLAGLTANCERQAKKNRQQPLPKFDSAVIGPATSDTLRAMVIEAEQQPQYFYEHEKDKRRFPVFYSPFATASAIDLLELGDAPRIPCPEITANKGREPWPMLDWRAQHRADPRYSGTAFHWYFNRCNLKFFSTVATDEELSHVILGELKRRDPQGEAIWGENYHVALITERDTYYGRALPRAFLRAAGLSEACQDDRIEVRDPAVLKREPGPGPAACPVLQYRYLRGLDGQTPPIPRGENDKREGDAKAQAQTVATMERAEGPKQFDHLRRLSGRIRRDSERQGDADHRSRLQKLGRYGSAQVRAIGVLGTDTYDKVAVLRALRDEFPRAVFFTTDLDARMLGADQYDWTRNVVVASSFGLELTPCLQKDVPPFRGTYQTAAYLAGRLAVHNVFPKDETGRATLCPEYPRQFWLPPHHGDPVSGAAGADNGEGYRLRLNQITIDKWLAAPRLFEIGRTAPFSLIDTPPQYQRAVGNVHPEADSPVPSTGALAAGIFIAAFASTGLLLIGQFRRWLLEARGFAREVLCDAGKRGRRWWLVVAIVVVVLILLGGLLLCAYLEAAAREGEPFQWFEGLSTWPSEILRSIALLVAAVGLFAASGRSQSNLAKTAECLGLAPAHDPGSRGAGCPRIWRALFAAMPIPEPRGNGDNRVELATYWRTYAEWSRPEFCLLRALAFAIAFMLIGFVLMETLGYPALPARGQVALFLGQFLIYTAVPAFLLLLFFVTDTTRLTIQFNNALRERDRGWFWPDGLQDSALRRALSPMDARDEVARRVVDAWLRVRLVSARTGPVSALVLPPLVVLALLVVARSTLFDGWDFPIGLVLVLSVSFAICVLNAWLLHTSADAVRRDSVRLLRDCKLEAQGSKPTSTLTPDQIETLIGEIESLREGAFVPPWERPVVVAGLLPLVSAGGVQLFQLLGLS